MIREFLFRAYLIAFAGSVIMGFIAGWKDGFFTAVGISLGVCLLANSRLDLPAAF